MTSGSDATRLETPPLSRRPGLARHLLSIAETAAIIAITMNMESSVELIQRAQGGDDDVMVLHPLCAGIPVDRAWECMHLYADKVLGVTEPRE